MGTSVDHRGFSPLGMHKNSLHQRQNVQVVTSASQELYADFRPKRELAKVGESSPTSNADAGYPLILGFWGPPSPASQSLASPMGYAGGTPIKADVLIGFGLDPTGKVSSPPATIPRFRRMVGNPALHTKKSDPSFCRRHYPSSPDFPGLTETRRHHLPAYSSKSGHVWDPFAAAEQFALSQLTTFWILNHCPSHHRRLCLPCHPSGSSTIAHLHIVIVQPFQILRKRFGKQPISNMGLLQLKEDRPTPKAVYNWRVYFCASVASFAACMIGYDSAFIGGTIALQSFRDEFGFEQLGSNELALIQANIVSVYQAGAFFGSLSAYVTSYFLGRRKSLFLFGIVFTLGAGLMCGANGDRGLGLIYAGRVLAGLGVGGCSNMTPIYISELSPPAVRGRLVGIYEVGWQVGGLVGFWINYGVDSTMTPGHSQWLVPMAVQVIPAGLLLIGLFGIPESPRWLFMKGKRDSAVKGLCWMRWVFPPFVRCMFLCHLADSRQVCSRHPILTSSRKSATSMGILSVTGARSAPVSGSLSKP